MLKSEFWGDETEAVNLALDWAIAHTVSGSDPKTSFKSSEELKKEVGVSITSDGLGAKEAMRLYSEVLNPATRSADDPMALAFIPGAPTRAAVAFDAVVSAANVHGGMWEMGAGAVFAENQVLGWIKSLLGWTEEAGGTFVSGGTLGNLSALSAAKHTIKEKWRQMGRFQNGRPITGYKLACASTAHSSVRTIATVLDVDIVTIPVDAGGHLTGEMLEKALVENPTIFAVVATSGTTNTGIVDDINSIVTVAHKYDIWVHIDGAYGGAALAAPSVRHFFKGIEKADSFIVDPHKWLFAPYDCCAVLYRDQKHAIHTFSQHAEYLDAFGNEEVNPSDLAIHLSRRTRGLPLWYSLAIHGTKKYEQAIEKSIENSRKCAEYIRKSSHLELLLDPELSVVVFARKGWTPEQYDEWSNKLAKAGELLCLPSKLNGRTILRLAFINPHTDVDKVIHILETTMK